LGQGRFFKNKQWTQEALRQTSSSGFIDKLQSGLDTGGYSYSTSTNYARQVKKIIKYYHLNEYDKKYKKTSR